MAFEVVLGPLPVRYLVNGERGLIDGVTGVEDDDDVLLRSNRRIRRIYMPLPGGKLVYLLLHWSDETDLLCLDQAVSLGAEYGSMFGGAVVGGLMTIRCNNCSVRYRAVVADAGNPLFGDVATRLRSHSFIESCPRCQHGLQPHVMEIIRIDQK